MEQMYNAIRLTIGWTVTIFFGSLGGIILWFIIKGKINLEKLISEPNGDASLSRFQLLIFTFVIAMSLFLIIVSTTPPSFPITIPVEILGLLGISGGSYLFAKGIQTSRDIGLKGSETNDSGNGK